MSTFLDLFNEIHLSIKGGSRAQLPVAEITEEFLLKEKIISKTGDKITYLDTTLIGENYLMQWNEQLILSLENLEYLVLANLELRELDLSSLSNLKTLELKSCNRDSIINISQNQRLERFDISLDLTRDSYPIMLYAHANQVGTVFPRDLEEQWRDKDGYLVLTLHLAPPIPDDIQATALPLKYLLRFKDAELGTILKKYWEASPEYFTKYARIEEAEKHEVELFTVLLEVEKRVSNNFYVNNNIPFDPEKDIVYPKLTERVFQSNRDIPDSMFQTVEYSPTPPIKKQISNNNSPSNKSKNPPSKKWWEFWK